MADKKISQLSVAASLTGSEPLPLVQGGATLQATVNQIQTAPISAQTANGVMYLNGSKVPTAGSGLVFDGNNLGVGTSSPVAILHTVKTSAGAATVGAFLQNSDTTTGTEVRLAFAANANVLSADRYGWIGYVNTGGTNSGALTFATTPGGTPATERMRLDASGNLGLGVTPSAWGAGYAAFQVKSGGAALWSDGAQRFFLSANVYYDGTNRRYQTTGVATEYVQNGGAHQWFTAPSGTAGNAISFTQAMTLDADGELGIGTTLPSAGLDVRKQETSSYNTARFSNGTDNQFVDVMCGRALTNGTAPGVASSLVMTLRSSGSSAGVLAFATGNDERARITSLGALLVGTTTQNVSTARYNCFNAPTGTNVAGSFKNDGGSSAQTIEAWNAATTGNNVFISLATEGTFTERGSISYNRAGGLVAYNTTSDYRAKDIIGPVQDPGATIDALKVYEGRMKGATQSRPMLVAHEAQAVASYCVTGEKDAVSEDGAPIFQQMDVSALVPLLLAEIQSLRARVAALEAA